MIVICLATQFARIQGASTDMDEFKGLGHQSSSIRWFFCEHVYAVILFWVPAIKYDVGRFSNILYRDVLSHPTEGRGFHEALFQILHSPE